MHFIMWFLILSVLSQLIFLLFWLTLWFLRSLAILIFQCHFLLILCVYVIPLGLSLYSKQLKEGRPMLLESGVNNWKRSSVVHCCSSDPWNKITYSLCRRSQRSTQACQHLNQEHIFIVHRCSDTFSTCHMFLGIKRFWKICWDILSTRKKEGRYFGPKKKGNLTLEYSWRQFPSFPSRIHGFFFFSYWFLAKFLF